MSNVIAFPTILTAPVVQQRRRGRLPKSIGSLRMARELRVQAEMEDELKRVEQTHTVAKTLYDAAAVAPDQLRGVVVVACGNDFKPAAWISGACRDDLHLAYKLLDHLSASIKRNIRLNRQR